MYCRLKEGPKNVEADSLTMLSKVEGMLLPAVPILESWGDTFRALRTLNKAYSKGEDDSVEDEICNLQRKNKGYAREARSLTRKVQQAYQHLDQHMLHEQNSEMVKMTIATRIQSKYMQKVTDVTTVVTFVYLPLSLFCVGLFHSPSVASASSKY